MAKIIDADMAAQSIVAPENMTHLVNALVDKRFDTKGKQAQKQLTKDAVKEAQKNLWEGLKSPRPLLASTAMAASEKAFYGMSLLDRPNNQPSEQKNKTRDNRTWITSSCDSNAKLTIHTGRPHPLDGASPQDGEEATTEAVVPPAEDAVTAEDGSK